MGSYFYEIAPGHPSYKGQGSLTYGSDQELKTGQVVSLAIRSQKTYGFVVKKVPKPSFPTKPIVDIANHTLPTQAVRLFSWLQEYYPTSLGVTANLFLPTGPVVEEAFAPSAVSSIERFEATDLQKKIIETIDITKNQSYILHGETGSGKTKVYLDVARKTLKAGRSVLILVPEIALSPQLYKEFSGEFKDQVILNHSGLTPRQRRIAWSNVRSTEEPIIVVGPRSSLFLPYNNLGLVVVDEFHEPAYKQESLPNYYGLRVASQLSKIHNCPIVFGSATPPVTDLFWANQKQVPILRLPKRTTKESPITRTITVDLTSDEEYSGSPLISKTLQREISRSIQNGDQSLLFLNKRGSSRMIICQDCGWRSTCPRCDLPLTYHGDKHQLSCHTCGYSNEAPTICQDCSLSNILFKSPGTKLIVEQLQKLFPSAKIARFDKDNKKSEQIGARHDEILNGDIDILVGTQILAKGHDLPRLGLVGILQADASLQFPDFTSNERSYQLINQLIGRIGRGHRPGTAIIQSFKPQNSIIQLATSNSWDEFYQTEISERKLFGFPPFYHLMKVEVARASSTSARSSLGKIVTKAKLHPGLSVVGPAPCFVEKRANKLHWQLVIKSKNRSALVTLAKEITGNYKIDLDPMDLL